MMAASTGCADVVVYLVQNKANVSKKDNFGRGLLQHAIQAQGDKQTLASWLMAHGCTEVTKAVGRQRGQRTTGAVSKGIRNMSGPSRRHNKKDDYDYGYEPQLGVQYWQDDYHMPSSSSDKGRKRGRGY